MSRRRIIPTATLDPRHSDEHYDELVIQWPGKPGRTWGKAYRARIFKATGRVELLTASKRQPVRLVQRNRLIDAVNTALFNYRTAKAKEEASEIAFNSNARVPTPTHRGTTDGVAVPIHSTNDPGHPSFVDHMASIGQPVTPLPPLQPGERRLVGVIDATPSWASLLPGLLRDWAEGSVPANKELARMAMAADAWVAHQKRQNR